MQCFCCCYCWAIKSKCKFISLLLFLGTGSGNFWQPFDTIQAAICDSNCEHVNEQLNWIWLLQFSAQLYNVSLFTLVFVPTKSVSSHTNRHYLLRQSIELRHIFQHTICSVAAVQHCTAIVCVFINFISIANFIWLGRHKKNCAPVVFVLSPATTKEFFLNSF